MIDDKDKNDTTWLVRCSRNQREFFQKTAAESGKKAADAVEEAMMSFKMSGNKEFEEESAEIDLMLERLCRMVRVKVAIVHERKKMLEEDNSEKIELTEKIKDKEDYIVEQSIQIYALKEELQKKNIELSEKETTIKTLTKSLSKIGE